MTMRTRIRAGLTTTAAGLTVLLGVAPRAGADYTVSGTVTVSGGGALPNVPIQVYDQNGDLVTTVFSAANGTYSVDLSNFGANAGAYTIREAAPTTSYQQVTPTIGANSNAAAASGLIPQNGTVATVVVPNTTASPTSPPQWNYNNQPNWVTGAPLLPFETPVNLTGPTTDLSKVVTITTNDAAVQPINVQNTGAQFKFNYSGTGAQDTITAGGNTYDLSQFHFHMPSENTLSGVNQSMELHFVYTNPATGAESVVAVFANDGGAAAPANSTVDAIIHNIQAGGTANGLTSPSTTTNGRPRSGQHRGALAGQHAGLLLLRLADHAAAHGGGQLVRLLEPDHDQRRRVPVAEGPGIDGQLLPQQPRHPAQRRPAAQRGRLQRQPDDLVHELLDRGLPARPRSRAVELAPDGPRRRRPGRPLRPPPPAGC